MKNRSLFCAALTATAIASSLAEESLPIEITLEEITIDTLSEPVTPSKDKLPSSEALEAAPPTSTQSPIDDEKAQDKTDELAPLRKEQERLALENALSKERAAQGNHELRQEIARLKLEKEQLSETLAIAELRLKEEALTEQIAFQRENNELNRQATLAKSKADKASAELKAQQATWSLETGRLEARVKQLESERKLADYAEANPIYLADPLKEDGTLVISDRRISLSGPIWFSTADHIVERINYYNNKNSTYPIFIVIDDSPGGSVMAGMRILKAMEGSSAPVYVVVKSFAASMAAAITTLAERSFAYPNAILLHHQVLAFNFGNLTETREHTRDLEEWWRRLADPVAKKMGISREAFIKQMYQNRSSGDWTEFADQAAKIKWVDHVVENIHETSLLVNPDKQKSNQGAKAQLDDTVIPRLNPKDLLYLYNPDNYYKEAQ